MFKVKNKETRMTSSVFVVDFIVNFTYSVVVIVNFEHVSHLVQREICRNTSFILEKRKKSNNFNRLQIEVFLHPNISPPSPNIGRSNLSFVHIYAQGVLTGFYGIT